MTLADQIRDFVWTEIIGPIRKKNPPLTARVKILSGDIVRAMRLHQRTPAVCGVSDARIFQNQHSIKLLQRTGPTHGMTATWTFLV